MSDVIIHKKNEVHIKLECEPHILYELQEYFTFEIEGAKFMPQMRSKMWDGKIRLLSTTTGEIYCGLLDKVIAKLKQLNYTYEFKENKYYGLPFEYNDNFTLENVKSYINTICKKIKPRDYQIDAVYQALKFNRKLLLSPTSSGKSLIIYSIIRYFTDQSKKILIIVPTTSLVEQMYKDFEEYGWNSEKYCHKIYQGKVHKTDKLVVISTWQSIYKHPRSFFEDFDVVIGDECLAPDTMITMEGGDKKQIKDIQIGDKVLTFNEQTKKIEAKPVKLIHKNISKTEKLYKVKLSNGNYIKITGNHKVLLKNGLWKRTDELVVGDIINTIE
jgi:hypothetical protein